MEDLTKTEVKIRFMQKEDIEEVERIEKLSFPSPWSSQLFSLELRKKDFAYYWVLEVNKTLAGYAGYWKIQDEAHLVTLAIHPFYRRRGLGKTLLTHILRDALKRGIKKVTLEVRKSNYPAQRLYEKLGFKKIAIRAHYYHDTGEDAIIYWKNF